MAGTAVIISDKDGGIMTELRSPDGAIPVFISPSGDASNRSFWNEKIDITASGDNTIHTPGTGKKFYVESLAFTCGASGEVQFKSGTTQISGPMNFNAYGGMAIDHGDAKLRGRAINDALILTVTHPSTLDIGGYVTGYDE